MHEQTLTCLYFDCRRVSYEAWVHGIDGEGIVGFGTQLCHHGCAHICLQIHLLHTQTAEQKDLSVCMFECVCCVSLRHKVEDRMMFRRR